MKPCELIRSLLLGNRVWEQFRSCSPCVSLGVFFAISGGNKLFVASRTQVERAINLLVESRRVH